MLKLGRYWPRKTLSSHLNDFVRGGPTWTLVHWVSKLKKLLRINKFFDMDFTIKINVKKKKHVSTARRSFLTSEVNILEFLASISLAFSKLYTRTWSRKKSTCFGLPDGTFFRALEWPQGTAVVKCETGRFDTNSSSETAQKFRSLQVKFPIEQEKHFGWIFYVL